MTSLSRRQFSTVTLLGGLGALALPRNSEAQIEIPSDAPSISVAKPRVSLTVNGVALTFLVDMASPHSTINPNVASWLGLSPTGEGLIPGPDLTLQAQLYSAPLAYGDNSIPFQLGAVENLNLVSEHASEPELEGILGGDFLGLFQDFSLTETSFTGLVGAVPRAEVNAVNQPLPPPFTVTYPVRKIGDSYYVAIEIIDGRGVKVTRIFLLDTGAQASVMNTTSAVALGLPPIMLGAPPFLFPVIIPVGGVGGQIPSLLTPVSLPGLGSFTFFMFNAPVGEGVAGIIGADVLGGSFTLQVTGGVGTLTITTPLGQVVELFISIARSVLKGIRGFVVQNRELPPE
jgi:hypothetical protein